MGIFIVVPLFGNTDDSKGYLISLVNMEKALNIEVDSDDYIVEIFDESKRIYFKPSDNKASVVRPGIALVDVYGTKWKVICAAYRTSCFHVAYRVAHSGIDFRNLYRRLICHCDPSGPTRPSARAFAGLNK